MDVHKSKRSRGNIKGKNILWQKVCNYKHTYLSKYTVMHIYFQSRPTIEGFVIFKFLPFRKNVPSKSKMYMTIYFFLKLKSIKDADVTKLECYFYEFIT